MQKDLFLESEDSLLSSAFDGASLIDPKFRLLKDFGRVLQYYDEPKVWQFSAKLNSGFMVQDGNDFKSIASGLSFSSQEIAITKCVCEAVERYCNHAFFKNSVTFKGPYENIKNKMLDPKEVVAFSKNQKESGKFDKFIINNKSEFSWVEGLSLTRNKEIYFPSQLVYLSYPLILSEPVIYPGISTGTAGGSCLSGALVRGICEIVERDAFMIFYLNKLKAKKLNLNSIKDSRIKTILDTMSRYRMELYTFDITTDVKIPTCLSVVLDRSGIGKALALGLKSDLDQLDAVVGSIEETFNSRTWLRSEYESSKKRVTTSDLYKKSDIRNRGLLWYPTEVISNLDFLIKSPYSSTIVTSIEPERTSGQQLKYILGLFNKLGYEILYKDITIPIFKEKNLFVVKTIIPKMQPFYLNENTKLLGGDRLYQVPKKLGFTQKIETKLNTFPHPFL